MNAQEQAALVRWIWGQPGAEPPHALHDPTPQRLAAYREHAKALAVRALAAAYPRLQAWLGEDDFAGLAWAYARAHPPVQGDMNRWGGHLAEFLAALPGMDAEPPALAAFDGHLHQIASAADDPPQDEGLWARLGQPDAAAQRLHLSPLLALLPLPESLCPLLQNGAEAPGDAGVHWLLWRAGWRPAWAPLAPEAAALLQALQTQTLGDALAAVPEGADALGPLLHQGWRQGWLLGLIGCEPARVR